MLVNATLTPTTPCLGCAMQMHPGRRRASVRRGPAWQPHPPPRRASRPRAGPSHPRPLASSPPPPCGARLLEQRVHRSDPSLVRQHVAGSGPLSGSGLRFIPVDHQGCTNHAPAEIERIATLLDELFSGSPRFTERDGQERALNPADVLIVAPYKRAGGGAQEAPAGVRRAGRYRRQVPGPAGSARHLLDDRLVRRRRAARDGVLVQPEPVERGDVTSAGAGRRDCEPAPCAGALPHAAADAAGERVLRVSGDSTRVGARGHCASP